ncbi:hypothetical protein H6P81_019302 [Aristolochia fimbriata]|uniref:Uncharacterized protein n=1 Tax=Aristolochia fimbriata TaxID=158543 RepID=A0AAV7DV27_ARIFI|nr:hypothetical protein H6P81_019302 [Aristolochia fimbriata]
MGKSKACISQENECVLSDNGQGRASICPEQKKETSAASALATDLRSKAEEFLCCQLNENRNPCLEATHPCFIAGERKKGDEEIKKRHCSSNLSGRREIRTGNVDVRPPIRRLTGAPSVGARSIVPKAAGIRAAGDEVVLQWIGHVVVGAVAATGQEFDRRRRRVLVAGEVWSREKRGESREDSHARGQLGLRRWWARFVGRSCPRLRAPASSPRQVTYTIRVFMDIRIDVSYIERIDE